MPGPASGHATRLHLHIARGQPDGQKICSVFPRCGHIIVNTLMNDTDAILLQRYTCQGDEAAFRGLVERYAGLVFSSALRHTGNAALAEEEAQNTFALLAHRAATRPVSDHLAGWLHHTSFFMARHLMRGERRRIARESAAAALDPKNPGRDMLLKAAGGLMKIPGMKKILAEQGKPIMEARYADLLDDHWQLGPEERGKAMDIICRALAEQASPAATRAAPKPPPPATRPATC